MKDRRAMNRLLGEAGLAQMNDPSIIPQLAALVRDDAHFGRLVCACDPEDRTAMYEAMAPNLCFRPRPLHEYLIAAQQDAEARQLPIQQADGTLRAFNVPEIRTVQRIVDEHLLSEHLALTCRKCTKQATFHGARKADAVQVAREAGWVYDAVSGPEPFEICPACPGGGLF
jgi:hypothetical protein